MAIIIGLEFAQLPM
ncbi:TPA: hypothetical protein MDA46_004136 [Escherichia coli]|nr:hypothetical protein [Escherichia coli]HBU7981243.1 hypothetical protein [Escherichia coli]